MTTKLLQWLFSPRKPIMRGSPYEGEDDAWGELERRGYSVLLGSQPNTFAFLDNGVLACEEWFTCESYEEMIRIRRRWAKEELEIVLRLEKANK